MKRSFLLFYKYIPLVLLSLLPVFWFIGRGDVLINGVDTNFPLDPLVWFERRLYVWQSTLNGGSDFSSSTAGIFFHSIQLIPHMVGLNLQAVQIISLVFWSGLIVFGSYIFAKTILPGRSIPQLILVVFYCLNIYLFNTWENVKVANLSLTAALPLGLTILLRLREGLSLSRAALYSFLTGIVISGGGINPAYFMCFIFVLFLLIFSELLVYKNKSYIFLRLKHFIMVVFVIVLTNSFWIIPSLNFISNNIPSSGSLYRLGFTNWIDSLSENTSIENIMRMQGAWDWYAVDSKTNLPLYIPYALNYFKNIPFIVFSFLIPVIAMLSLLFRLKDKNYLYVFFGILLVLGVFLGAGTHFPTGLLYRFLIDHLPFFSLFRSPWYIFTPMVTLSVASLVGMLFYRFQEKRFKQNILNKYLFISISVTLILINMVYTYPMVLGKIFRAGREDSFFTSFPNYVFETKNWLNNLPKTERIINYPADEIEKFSWGYRGIESILSLFARHQILFSPLNTLEASTSVLVKDFYTKFNKGEFTAAYSIAQKLGATMIIKKEDQDSLVDWFPDSMGNRIKVVGKWNFYKLPNKTSLIHSPKVVFYGYPSDRNNLNISITGDEDLIINPGDSQITRIEKINVGAGKLIATENSQSKDYQAYTKGNAQLIYNVKKRNMFAVDFTFEIPTNGAYQIVLERYKVEDFGIDLKKNLQVKINNQPFLLEVERVNDSHIFFKQQPFSAGINTISLELKNNNLIKGLTDSSGYQRVGEGSFDYGEENGRKYLNILNISQDEVSAQFAITPFDPHALYLIQFEYKRFFGSDPNIKIDQLKGTNPLAKSVTWLPSHQEWQNFGLYYEPVRAESSAYVLLTAPYFSKNPLGSRIGYTNLEVYRVFANNLFLINKSNQDLLESAKIEPKTDNPVLHEGLVKSTGKPHIIVFSESYSPEWILKLFTKDGRELPLKPVHFSANLYANGWYIEGSPSEYQYKIYYQPQNLFLMGGVVSVVTGFITLVLNVPKRWRKFF